MRPEKDQERLRRAISAALEVNRIFLAELTAASAYGPGGRRELQFQSKDLMILAEQALRVHDLTKPYWMRWVATVNEKKKEKELERRRREQEGGGPAPAEGVHHPPRT